MTSCRQRSRTYLPTGSARPVLSATAKAYNAVPPRLPAKMYSGVTVEYHAVPRRVHAARIVPHGSVRQHHSRRGERDSPTVQCTSLAGAHSLSATPAGRRQREPKPSTANCAQRRGTARRRALAPHGCIGCAGHMLFAACCMLQHVVGSNGSGAPQLQSKAATPA